MSNCDNFKQSWSYDKEPKLQLFEHENCIGANVALPVGFSAPGTYNNNGTLGQRGVFPNSAMSSMYIPPHVRATAYTFWDSDTNAWVATFGPGWYRDASTLNAGSSLYRNGPNFTLDGGYNHNWNDQLTGIEVGPQESWSSYASQCCYGRFGNKSVDACTSPAGNSIYGPNSDPTCSTPLSAFCQASVTNAFSSPLCQEWYAGNGAGAQTAIKRSMCNSVTGLASRECRDWCRANPGQCDNGSQEYCALDANINSTYCGCITSPSKKYNPKCVDAFCISGVDDSGIGGYVTASQNSTGQCPNIIDCQTNIDLASAGRTTAGNITVSNNCGPDGDSCPASGSLPLGALNDRVCADNKTMMCTPAGWVVDATGTSACPTGGGGTGGGTGGTTLPPLKSGMNMYILIFIVILVLAVGGFFLYRRNMSAKQSGVPKK